MSHLLNLCDPCKSQKKQKTATQWCIQCDEFLCPSCIDYHKALTITKDHKIVNKEDRDIIVHFTQSIDTICTEHTDSEVEYYCSIHDVSCCRVCKEKTHDNCSASGVKQICDLNDESVDLNSNVKAVEKNIHFLDSIIDNRNIQIMNLEVRADSFAVEMKQTKDKILTRLDSIESSLKEQFSYRYKSEVQKLQNEKETFVQRQKQLTQRRDQLLKIVELNTLSKVQRFLGDKKIMTQNQREENEIKSDAKSLTNTSCTYDLSCWQLEIKDKIKFQSLPCEIKLGSSVAIAKSNATQGSEILRHECWSAKTTERGKTSITDSQNKDKVGFMYKSHFCIFRNEWRTTFHCIKKLPNGRIVLGEVSQPKLFVYSDSGSKLGEVQLRFPPGEIALIDTSAVAVTVNNCIVIVDAVKFKIMNTFYLKEKCYGIVFINGNILVNCEYSGFILMSLAGENIKRFSFTNAILYLCACDKNVIASVKCDSEFVHFFNIQTQLLTTSRCSGLFGAAGITADTDGNVYALCNKYHKVYMSKAGIDHWNQILDTKDKINNPVSIDYDTKTDSIYISNNKGTSVYVYGRKN